MRHLYSCILYLLLPPVLLRLWWKGRRVPGYRRHWRERLGYCGVRPAAPLIWLHAVSVGEVRAAQPLLRALQQQYGDYSVLLTTTTPTGRATARQLFGDTVACCYLPYDLPGAVRRFLDATRPAVALVMETEIWPNLYHALHQRDIPLLLLNARLSESSLNGYLRLRGLFAPALAVVRCIAVQGEADARRFARLGAQPRQLSVAGNLKFDAVLPEDFSVRVERLQQRFGNSRPLWVAGSTHPGEESQLLAAQQRLLQDGHDAVLVIAPRHPERADEVVALCRQQGLIPQRFSDNAPLAPGVQVVVVDVLGELQYLYGIASAAFIGGSLVDAGGHNPLEAVLAGTPVISGPHTDNFYATYAALQQADAVLRVEQADALAGQISACLKDAALRRRLTGAACRVLEQHRQALAHTLELLQPFLDQAQGRTRHGTTKTPRARFPEEDS